MAFTSVDVLSMVPSFRLSSCAACGRPHTEGKIREIQARLSSSPLPSSLDTLLRQLKLIAKELLCAPHEDHKDSIFQTAMWWFGEVKMRSTVPKPDMPGAYPEDEPFNLETYLQHKWNLLSGKHNDYCSSCGKSFKKGATVCSTICGQHVCRPCAKERQRLRCRKPSFCPECDREVYWAWTFGATDPYVQYNMLKPYLNLRIEYNGEVVFDEQYSSSRPLWPLLGEFYEYLRLDPASADFYIDGRKVDRFSTLDRVRASSSVWVSERRLTSL